MQVLNAKNYGVPQNRDRVFVVSIMGDEKYDFPKPFELEKRLKDVLESNVDESFYLKKKVIDTFLRRNAINEKRGNGFRWSPTDGDCVAKAVTSNAGSRDCDNYIYVVGNVNPSGKGMNGNVFDSEFLCPTLTTNKGEGPKILEPFIKQYPRGFNNGFEYKNGYAPAITTSSWENNNFLVEPVTCAMRGRNPDNPSDRRSGIPMQQRIEVGSNVANCITTVQKDSMVLEPSILAPRRTEYGKAIRKDYEAGLFKESRHNMTALEPRKDGISNTITTVQKDNLLVEPTKTILGINPVSRKLEFKGCKSICAISPALKATKFDAGVVQGYRIRKLTPRECFRLMGVSESDIDKIQAAGISKTQQYKMAGNSIVVDVLYHIFRKLFIDKSDENKQLSFF